MADTLKASKEGLTVVDRARRRKGWTKTRTPAWWDAAFTTQATLKRFWRGIAIQRENFIAICQAVGIGNWEEIAELYPVPEPEPILEISSSPSPDVLKESEESTDLSSSSTRIDWGEAPEIPYFCGRELELRKLERWILGDRCKLVTLLGMGGIGKTSLAATLVAQIQGQFDRVVWRSLLGAPPLASLLASLIQFISQGEETLETDNVQPGITQLIHGMQSDRCLIVLDEAEVLLRSHRDRTGKSTGQYREGYEDYGEFFKRVGSDRHQSCILLTSREKPGEIVAYEGQMLPIRSLQLGGLKPEDAIHLLQVKGLSASSNESSLLINFYSGNPLALKIITTTIQEVFSGNVASFLNQNTLMLGDRLRSLLAQQIDRLSPLETEVLYWLTLEQKPLSLEQLRGKLLFPLPQSQLLETLASLERRSTIDKIAKQKEALFTLQPLVMKYVTEKFIEQALEEIETVLEHRNLESFTVLKNHALPQLSPSPDSSAATAISPPPRLLHRLLEGLQMTLRCDNRRIGEQLSTILPLLRGESSLTVGYLGANLRQMFNALGLDLDPQDWQDIPILGEVEG